MTRAVAALGLLAVFAIPSFALDGELGKEPGPVLLDRCEAAIALLRSEPVLDAAQRERAQSCVAFVDGFIFGHGWAAWRENRDMYYCPPESFSASVAIPALMEYLHAHEDRLDAPAHVLLFAALADAFPCTPRPGEK